MAIFITPEAQPSTMEDLQAFPGRWQVVVVADRAARAAAAATEWVQAHDGTEATTRRLGSAHLVLARTV